MQPDFYDNDKDFDISTNENDLDGDDRADGADNDIPVLLLPHEEDCGNDFLEDPFVGSITGHVRDEEGTPMENVTLKLYVDNDKNEIGDGPGINTVTTNAQGKYHFDGVEPGYYFVEETQPNLYNSIYDYDQSTGEEDEDGDDRDHGPDNNIPVDLMPGEIDSSNNFTKWSPRPYLWRGQR